MILGDLERLLAQLYPVRLPIAIGLMVALGVIGYVARRRHWAHVARRHPRASMLVAPVALAVGLPVGWVLRSPLLIRTELTEVRPLAATQPSSAPSVPARPSSSAGGPGPSSTPGGGRVVLQKEVHGADEFHVGRGTALLAESEPGQFILRFESFSVRNGPDLFVYRSPSSIGYTDGALELGPLKASDGSFNYEVAAGTNINLFKSAVMWCRAFSVLFATAPLGAG